MVQWVKVYICFKWNNKKMQAYQYLDIDIVAPVFNFIKNKGQAQVFSFEFCHFFSLCRWFYFKQDSNTGIFIWILRIFSTCNL